MTQKTSTRPTAFEMATGGKTDRATYVVEDQCVQVTYNGRKSTWTQIGGSTPEMVARMLLHEVIGPVPDTIIEVVAKAINSAVYGNAQRPAGCRAARFAISAVKKRAAIAAAA